LLDGGASGGFEFSRAKALRWPVFAEAEIDAHAALIAWYGSLPLYLFVILGPAVAGACLSVLFVGEFEKRARAARAAARQVRPLEPRLLVRLAAAERAANEATRSKSEFIAHMSHELRTPLNAIIGFSEVISKGLFGPAGHPKYVEYAEDIARAGRGLHEKIGDVLEYANVEAGRYPLKPAPFDIAALAAKCVGEHRGRAFSRRIALDLVFAEPVEAIADLSAVARIAGILLTNALAHEPQGGRIWADVREDEGAAVLRFVRSAKNVRNAAPPDNETASMSRLDLAIATTLARRMGGALVIAGADGASTVTELRLPKLRDTSRIPRGT
jgi:two-component system cell cycle sensor histidine kinase PleC